MWQAENVCCVVIIYSGFLQVRKSLKKLGNFIGQGKVRKIQPGKSGNCTWLSRKCASNWRNASYFVKLQTVHKVCGWKERIKSFWDGKIHMWSNLCSCCKLLCAFRTEVLKLHASIPPLSTEWWCAGVVICLERGANLNMAQLMPLPLTVSCLSKIHIGFTFLVLAHLGSPGKRASVLKCVAV